MILLVVCLFAFVLAGPAPAQEKTGNWVEVYARIKTLHDRGAFTEAQRECEAAVIQSRSSGASPGNTESFQLRCALMQADLGHLEKAEAEIRQVIADRTARLGGR